MSAFAGCEVHAFIDFLVHFSLLVEEVHAGLGLVESVVLAVVFGDEEGSLGLVMVEARVGGFLVGVDGDVEAFHLFGEVVKG